MNLATTPTIVVGIDGSECGRTAALWSADTAHRRGWAVRLVHGFVLSDNDSSHVADEDDDASTQAFGGARRMLEEIARDLRRRHPALTVTTALRIGHPTHILAEESVGASMIVVGSHASPHRHDALMGSVAGGLAGLTRLSAGTSQIWNPYRPPGTGPVIVATDGSPDAAAALGLGFEHAGLTGAGLTVVRVCDDHAVVVAGRYTGSIDVARAVAEQQADLKAELAPWQEKYPEVRCEHIVVAGHPSRTLLELTRADRSARR